jgi:hypothetical protein
VRWLASALPFSGKQQSASKLAHSKVKLPSPLAPTFELRPMQTTGLTGAQAFGRLCRVNPISAVAISAAVALNAFAAEKPHTVNKDWEDSCGGSNIQVTSVQGQIVRVDAEAEHFADGRQWRCHFKDGKIVSALYRHFKVVRKAVGDAGGFTTEHVDEQMEVFHFPDSEIKGLDPERAKDLKAMLSIAMAKEKK